MINDKIESKLPRLTNHTMMTNDYAIMN